MTESYEEMSPEERQAWIDRLHFLRVARCKQAAQLRRKGKSLRATAGELGVTECQVRRDLKLAENRLGLDAEPKGGRIKGLDGSDHPYTK